MLVVVDVVVDVAGGVDVGVVVGSEPELFPGRRVARRIVETSSRRAPRLIRILVFLKRRHISTFGVKLMSTSKICK